MSRQLHNFDLPYMGPLDIFFAEACAVAEQNVLYPHGKQVSFWTEYQGPDCGAFKLYVRVGIDVIVLANIIGLAARADESAVRKGRMPKIIAACFKSRPRLVVESVVNHNLRTYLAAVGFKSTEDYIYNYEKVRGPDD